MHFASWKGNSNATWPSWPTTLCRYAHIRGGTHQPISKQIARDARKHSTFELSESFGADTAPHGPELERELTEGENWEFPPAAFAPKSQSRSSHSHYFGFCLAITVRLDAAIAAKTKKNRARSTEFTRRTNRACNGHRITIRIVQ